MEIVLIGFHSATSMGHKNTRKKTHGRLERKGKLEGEIGVWRNMTLGLLIRSPFL